jgi:hypothetical protein
MRDRPSQARDVRSTDQEIDLTVCVDVARGHVGPELQ